MKFTNTNRLPLLRYLMMTLVLLGLTGTVVMGDTLTTSRKVVGGKIITTFNVPADQIVYLNGPILSNAKDVVKELKEKAKNGKELYLLIDSPGGSVTDGGLIISQMESSPVPVNTVCTDLCASMAFVILEYGTNRYALDRAMLMAHPASGDFQGNFNQIQVRYTVMRRYIEKMNTYISNRAHLKLKDFNTLITSEFWIDAEDSVNTKYLDGLVNINTTAIPNLSVPVFFNEVIKNDIMWQ